MSTVRRTSICTRQCIIQSSFSSPRCANKSYENCAYEINPLVSDDIGGSLIVNSDGVIRFMHADRAVPVWFGNIKNIRSLSYTILSFDNLVAIVLYWYFCKFDALKFAPSPCTPTLKVDVEEFSSPNPQKKTVRRHTPGILSYSTT